VIGGRLAAACAAAVILGRGGAARACTPSVDRVLAFDEPADVYVTATWNDRERAPEPPSMVVPNSYELRRLSTGEKLAEHKCWDVFDDKSPPRICDWKQVLAAALPGKATWQRRGPLVPPGRVRLAPTKLGADRGVALEARGPRGWRRALWIEYGGRMVEERVRYSFTASELAGGRVVLAMEAASRGGNCAYTTTRAVVLDEADLRDPTNAGRQARLLRLLGPQARFETWMTAAEIAPLPPERLLDGIAAAARQIQHTLAAAWWTATTARLPPARVAALLAELRRRDELADTRAVMNLDP
jgi:hypothetical protein